MEFRQDLVCSSGQWHNKSFKKKSFPVRASSSTRKTQNISSSSDGTNCNRVNWSICTTGRNDLYLKDEGLAELSTLFSELNEAYSRRKTIVDQIAVSNVISIPRTQSLNTRSAVLLAKLEVLEKEVPKSYRRKTSSKSRCSLASNTQIQEAALVAVVSNLDLQFYSTGLSENVCADKIPFHEVP